MNDHRVIVENLFIKDSSTFKVKTVKIEENMSIEQVLLVESILFFLPRLKYPKDIQISKRYGSLVNTCYSVSYNQLCLLYVYKYIYI